MEQANRGAAMSGRFETGKVVVESDDYQTRLTALKDIYSIARKVLPDRLSW